MSKYLACYYRISELERYNMHKAHFPIFSLKSRACSSDKSFTFVLRVLLPGF